MLGMSSVSSVDDRAFRDRFEALELAPEDFNHRAHLQVAYVYLTEGDTESAYQRMRDTLQAFLKHLGIADGKYHDTMTRAWILAVRHFMEKTGDTTSAASLIDQNPIMLDTKIMETHYSTDLLFSQEARARFVEPDLDPIPQYDE